MQAPRRIHTLSLQLQIRGLSDVCVSSLSSFVNSSGLLTYKKDQNCVTALTIVFDQFVVDASSCHMMSAGCRLLALSVIC